MQPETTLIERQEALELLAAFREGVDIMEPEPRHLQALLELRAEGPNHHRRMPQ